LTEYYISDSFDSAADRLAHRNQVLKALVTELLILYLAFTGWSKRFRNNHPVIYFTYHKKSAYAAILGTMAFLLVVETIGLHLLLMQWNIHIANIISALSLYGLLWLIGDYHAIRLHPVILTNEEILLRTGVRWKGTIPLDQISQIEIGNPRPEKNKNYLRASVLWPRLIIHLRNPIRVRGMFGLTRHPTQIGLSIDEPELFKNEILRRQSS
jgi:hypothetical protein